MSILYCMFSRLESGDIRSGHGAAWIAGDLETGVLDFVVACWMVPVRLAACFCGMLGAGLGCCLLDGTRAPGYLLLWVVAAASKCVASKVFICR